MAEPDDERRAYVIARMEQISAIMEQLGEEACTLMEEAEAWGETIEVDIAHWCDGTEAMQ